MKANISFSIEIEDIEPKFLKEWIEYQFGLRADISLNNPLCNIDLKDGEVEPFYTLSIKP